VRDISPPRFYGDKAGARVDDDLAAEHKEAVRPLTEFLREVVKETDKALRRREPATLAQCPLNWIATWAAGDAWLGTIGTRQGEYQRKWDLAGVALAYLKLKRWATPEQRVVIEPWLVRFADAARAFFDDPGRKRNNHWYWLGVALAATSLGADSPRHWEAARAIMRDGLSDIAPDGTLPHELEREGRALHYHAFALTPLVVLAEIGGARGENWYELEKGALHRLAALTMRGIADPAVFDRLAGHAQERPPSTGAGWLALYAARYPERVPKGLPDVPDKHRWLGGDVRLLAQTIGALARPPR
jgi:poly(beta-D-mannuronate) lyase